MLKIKLTSNLSPGPPLELPVSECCSQRSLRERKHHPALPHSHPGGGQRPPRLSLFVCPALAPAALRAKVVSPSRDLPGRRQERGETSKPSVSHPSPSPSPLRPREGDWLIPGHPELEASWLPVLCCPPPVPPPLRTPVSNPQSTACVTSSSGSVLFELPAPLGTGQQWEGSMQPSAFPQQVSFLMQGKDLSSSSIQIHSVARPSFLLYEGGPQTTQRGYENPLSGLKSQAGPTMDFMTPQILG